MSDLGSLLKKVSGDQASGSSEIYSELLKGLTGALASKPSTKEWAEFSVGLSRVKRSMAPLQNVAGSIRFLLNAQIPEEQFNSFVKGFLNDLAEREARAPEAIALKLIKEQRPRRVLTLSYSGTVMATLAAMPTDVEVVVAESLPLGEGAVTYRRLTEKGLKVSLIRDSMIAREMSSADLALVGADGVCPEGVVNKVGTSLLALACKEANKPLVVVCSTSKLIPVLEMDPVDSSRTLDGLRYREALFELTPLELVHSVITEEGVLSGKDMRQRLLRDRSKMKETECQEC